MANSIITLRSLGAGIAIAFLTACTAIEQTSNHSSPIQTLNRETADLADVSRDALLLAEQVSSGNVLMVFDIDNTLLAMEQPLGSDQWYEWQSHLSKEDRCNPWNVGNRFAVQGALFFAGAMRPTQADAARQLRTIQERNITTIAVTSRGPAYRLQTFRELRRNNYSFSRSAFGPVGGYAQSFVPVENGRLTRYEDGVFMTAGQHKGQMLNTLLEKTGTNMPAVIVMADDKQKNLDQMINTFSALDVPVHAWHYTGEDLNVQNFDPTQANAQWKSIEQALRTLQSVLGENNFDLSSAVLPADCK